MTDFCYYRTNAVVLGSQSHGTHDHILLSQIRDSSNLEGQAPVFIFSGAEWYSYIPWNSILVTSYDFVSLALTEYIENAAIKSSSTVACVSVVMGECLLSHCVPLTASLWSTILSLSLCVTIQRVIHNSWAWFLQHERTIPIASAIF